MIVSSSFRRPAQQMLIAVLLGIAATSAVRAAWEPDKPIELVVPAKGGGSLDVAMRSLQQIWQDMKLFKVPITVVNKPGGGQNLAMSYVNQATGDGHRILLVSSTLLSNHLTGKTNLKYSDFTTLGQLCTEYMAVSVRKGSPVTTGKDLIARLRSSPESLSVAVGSALATTSHLGLAIALKRAGVDVKRVRTVVFAGGPESITNLLGGHVDVVSGALTVARPHWRAGTLRLLAITAPQRLGGEFSNVPTWREQGVDAAVSNWRFLVAPPGLTEDQIAYWDGVFSRTVDTPQWKKIVEKNEWVNHYIPSGAARKYLEQQNTEQHEVLLELGLAK